MTQIVAISGLFAVIALVMRAIDRRWTNFHQRTHG
jgi:hypothetical protein